jgi:surfactin synthase thioesterase subunit
VRNPWFAQGEPQDLPGVRLFCLPYAGGSAASYREWNERASGFGQVCPLELPGRGGRSGEPPVSRLPLLVDMVADALAEYLDRPYALFGHSMGGLLAFELCRVLNDRGLPQPAHLFVSGAAPPELPRPRLPVHAAPDTDVLEELRFIGGTPPEILDDPELVEMLLPVLRADFSVLETYQYRARPPLSVPMTVFGGDADPVVASTRMQRWQRHTRARSRLIVLSGDHFFLHSAAAEVMRAITDVLRQVVPEALPGPRGSMA